MGGRKSNRGEETVECLLLLAKQGPTEERGHRNRADRGPATAGNGPAHACQTECEDVEPQQFGHLRVRRGPPPHKGERAVQVLLIAADRWGGPRPPVTVVRRRRQHNWCRCGRNVLPPPHDRALRSISRHHPRWYKRMGAPVVPLATLRLHLPPARHDLLSPPTTRWSHAIALSHGPPPSRHHLLSPTTAYSCSFFPSSQPLPTRHDSLSPPCDPS